VGSIWGIRLNLALCTDENACDDFHPLRALSRAFPNAGLTRRDERCEVTSGNCKLYSGLLVATLLMCSGATAVAGRDVRLGPGGRFQGQVVGAEGTPLANAPVHVRSSRGAVVVQSDARGAFSVNNVGAGEIEVTTSRGKHHLRGWSEKTAPPAAENAAFLREERPGNRGGRGFARRAERSGRDFSNHPSLFAPMSP